VTAPAGLFAHRETVAALREASAIVLLIGGYDGSGNFGDIAQLDAALQLVDRLGPGVLALPVIEPTRVEDHANLIRCAVRPAEHVLVCGDDAISGLVPAATDTCALFSAVYLYGGGYLNARWGDRKLAMLSSAEAFLRALGIEPRCRVATGVQVEARWARDLAPADVATLQRFELLGGRDRDSARALASLAPSTTVIESADDAVAVLRGPTRSAAAAHATNEGPLRVNVHVADHRWMGEDLDTPLRCAALVARVGERADRTVLAAPVLAYEDRWISDGPAAARFAEACAVNRVEVEAPRVLRPAGMGADLDHLARSTFSVSCSYHVALSSLMLGLPTVVVHGNDYYDQKAAGLREMFDLPAPYTIGAGGAWPGHAEDVASDLLADRGRNAWDQRLALGRQDVLARRDAAERDVLSRLAAAALSALTDATASLRARSAQTTELMDELGTLRDDLQAIRLRGEDGTASLGGQEALAVARTSAAQHRRVAQLESARRLAAEAQAATTVAATTAEYEAKMAAQGAHAADLAAYVVELERRLSVVYGSSSWALTAPLRSAGERLRQQRQRS
jgi:Polysaccharide pyruvyl transferase